MLCFLFPGYGQGAQGQGLITNGSFEQRTWLKDLPKGWKTWVREGHANEVDFQRDSSISYDGKHSVRIVNRGYGDCCYSLGKNIAVKPQCRYLYRVQAYVKCDNVEGAASVKVFTVNTKGEKNWQAGLAKSAGSHDWRRVSAEFALTPDIFELGVQLELVGPGRAWFDMVSLESLEAASMQTLVVEGKTFVEIPDMDNAKLPHITEEQRIRGYFAFVCSDYDGIFSSSVPEGEDITSSVELFMAKNEYEPAVFSVYALRDLEDVRISVTDLIEEGGKRIRNDAIDIRVVRHWPQRISWNSANYRIIPELLEHRDAIDIAGGTAQQFWLTIKTPIETVSGEYIARVSVIPDNADPMTIALKVNVWSFELKTPPHRKWGIYLDSRRWANCRLSQIEIELRDIREHGISAILFQPISAEHCTVEKGEIHVDLSQANVYVEIFKRIGFEGPIVLSLQDLDVIVSKAIGQEKILYDEQFAKAYYKAIKALAKSAEDHEWPEILFHVVDEPANSEEKRRKAVILYKLLKEADCRTFTTADVAFCNEVLDPWIDVRCYSVSYVGKTGRQCAARTHETTASHDAFWWYGSGCYAGQEGNMSANRYLTGVLFWKTGASAQWSWTYQRPYGDPFNDFDGIDKDACITYPAADEGNSIPTLQWEGIREGIDDARYIYTLETLIDEGLHSSDEFVKMKAKDAQLKLSRLIDAVPWLYEFKFTNEAANEMRRKIAQTIMELMPQ